ncbi:MAG: hypothetical protein NTV01_21520 [Bacteroidia bacterium]|nr:hypothetical protein [Bacteroidia bacterium]
MKKILKIGAWICAGIAAILMLLGSVAAIFAGGNLFNHFWANYFYPSVSFIGAGILMLLLLMADKDK